MKTGLIITGGPVDLAFAGSFLKQIGAEGIDAVISVDAGLAVTEKLGLKPGAVVGDFDTVAPEVLARYRKEPDILWDIHRPEKDETDTELAINTAIKLGCERLYILGATGKRLDHELSNIHLLKLCLDRCVEGYICDANNKIYLISGERVFHRESLYGKYVSFIPLSQKVLGITLTGFKYPLCEKDIEIGVEAGLCVSNEVAEEQARIRFREGTLICIESRD